MSPETASDPTSLIEESHKISEELLQIEQQVQEAAKKDRASRLSAVRTRLGYQESTIINHDVLVDTRIEEKELVVSPDGLSAVLPLTKRSANTTETSRKNLERILTGDDDRQIVIVGPCSIHDPEAALEYAQNVKQWRKVYDENLEIIMRFHIEKPRSERDWKGMLSDPLLDDSEDMNLGATLVRMLACKITDMGVPLATERLNANTPQFLNGLITLDLIGARNVADQKAREYASGTSSAVGIKNPQDGKIETVVQAVSTANAPHAFIGMEETGNMCVVRTKGNELAHVVLRGSDKGSNYSSDNIAKAKGLLQEKGLLEAIIIDASHGNSNKQANKQLEVVLNVAEQIALGEFAIKGVMIESNLVAGKQELKKGVELVYGQSITDECVGLDQTLGMLEVLSHAVKRRREIIANTTQ